MRRHCGHRLVFADEASRRKDVTAAELDAAMIVWRFRNLQVICRMQIRGA